MVKKNPENKFKKIILTWWVWVIIAIVSYFIFASIPITWNESGFGWDTFAGLNFVKTILAYFTQIAWIVAISLLVFAGIKKIQKTKINDYWKISLTILGIVIIIAYVIYSISSFGIFNKSSSEDYTFNKDDSAKEFLTEQGYEVLSLSFGSYSTEMAIQNGFTTDVNCYPYRGSLSSLESINDTCWSNFTQAYVEMKSLGNTNSQIWDGLTAFASYDGVSIYRIDILSPTETCTYYLTGKTYDEYLNVDIINNYSEENLQLGRAMAQKVNEELEKYKSCY